MIYVKFPFGTEEADHLRSGTRGEELIFETDLPASDHEATARRAEIILGNVPVAWLEDATELEWLQLSSAGFTPYTVLEEGKIGFTVTNCAGVFGTPVAETALAGLLALLREIPTFVEDKGSANWRGAAIRPQLGTLTGSRVLILGHGSIGGSFRELLSGFSCEIETMGNREGADFYTREELDDRLPTADVVMAALPETEETNGLFDAERLGRLSPNCILINVGRGTLIDEAALLPLLREGKIRGAVLDVTQHEPLPADDPLWDAPRVILTQHSAGGAENEHRKIADRFLHNLKKYRRGEQLDHTVNLRRGY